MVKKPAGLIPPLMKHQLQSIERSETSNLVVDLSDAGTGKTAVRIAMFAKRRRKGGGCLLVVAPRTLLVTAWKNDFTKFAPDMVVSVATATNREDAFAADADVYVTNHDAVKWLVKKPKSFFAKFSEIAIDESTAFKHHSSQRAKALAKILHQIAPDKFKYRSIMTATPTSNGITDLWHQIYLLDRGKTLGPSFYAFRNSVCEPHQVGRMPNMIRWVDKEGAEEAVYGLLEPFVVRHELDKCADIPERHTYAVNYTLPPKQQKAYDILETSQLLLLKEKKVTAINAAAVATKLLQVASGAVYDDEQNYHVVDTGRYELIMDLVEARKHSLVLFIWKHQRDLLVKECESRGLSYCVLDGDTGDRDRAELVANYQKGFYRVMFAHPKTAGHGLTLTKGTATIWASPTPDLEHWIQASSRQRRIGQKEKTENIVVLAEGTKDERVYHELLMPKDKRMKTLLDLFVGDE